MLIYLKPFYSTLSKLETDAALAESQCHGAQITKAIALAGTCDFPAKCLVCNSIQFNGFQGCLKCKSYTSECGRGHMYAFPFDKVLKEKQGQQKVEYRMQEHFRDRKSSKQDKRPYMVCCFEALWFYTWYGYWLYALRPTWGWWKCFWNCGSRTNIRENILTFLNK